MWNLLISFGISRSGRGRGSSVGRARDFWSGGPRFDSRCGRPLPTGWVGVSIMWPANTEVGVSRLMCGNTLNCQTLCLGAHPRYNLVVDMDVNKPNKQTNHDLALLSRYLSWNPTKKLQISNLKVVERFCLIDIVFTSESGCYLEFQNTKHEYGQLCEDERKAWMRH